jgi:hypothetical protein
MNIFVTSPCPVESAKFLDDKRVNKMILESAQMLSTAINENGLVAPYKSTHKNHPANAWARETRSNWFWLYKHYIALCEQYTKTTGKIHKTSLLKDTLLEQSYCIPNGELTPFVNCAANLEKNLNFKQVENVFDAYTLYLKERWKHDKLTPTWKNR